MKRLCLKLILPLLVTILTINSYVLSSSSEEPTDSNATFNTQKSDKIDPIILEPIFNECLTDVSCIINECKKHFPDDVKKDFDVTKNSFSCIGEVLDYPKNRYPNTKWEILGSKSKMDDSKQVSIVLYSESGPVEISDDNHPMLAIMCRENKTEVLVNTYIPANPEYGLYNEYTVRIRFDDEKPFKQHWTESTDNKALFAPNPISLARKINESKRMMFEFVAFQSGPLILEFDVRELEPYLKILADTCHWKL